MMSACRAPTPLETTSAWNADSSASAVSTALPMAKPFPVAAVVLPSASRASVRSRTFGIAKFQLLQLAKVFPVVAAVLARSGRLPHLQNVVQCYGNNFLAPDASFRRLVAGMSASAFRTLCAPAHRQVPMQGRRQLCSGAPLGQWWCASAVVSAVGHAHP